MELSEMVDIINEFGISYKTIAKKMGMNESTFRLKINPKFEQYRFIVNSEKNEINELREVVLSLAYRISCLK